MLRVLLLAALTASLLSSPAYAGKDVMAERVRLQEEMTNLASRNVWHGVERNYLKITELDVPMLVVDHVLGAQSAQSQGNILAAVMRLELAVALNPEDPDSQAQQIQAQDQLNGILKSYGRIEINVHPPRIAGLIRFKMPFPQQEVQTILVARQTVLDSGNYRGLLPIGDYMIDGEKFKVVASDVWQEITVE
ncbi:MAG: hypothetical protein GWP91_03830 [Rhodobacterales bacterium]|nr:hypothetical protein [Rhodobacterales bacterium]